MTSLALTATFVAMALIPAARASADVILNQLPANVTAQNANASQIFEAEYAGYNAAVVDDFTITGTTDITSVSAALLGYSGFSTYGNITSYTVQVYNSQAAAVANLTGNIASINVLASGVSLTTPYSAAYSALADIPLNLLLGAGTYYFAVTPNLNYSPGGQIGVVNEGTGNSFQTNPGGAFNLTGNISQLGTNADYEVQGTAVPEPASFAILSLGLGTLAFAARKRA